jgi:hypothetical protein
MDESIVIRELQIAYAADVNETNALEALHRRSQNVRALSVCPAAYKQNRWGSWGHA